MILWILLFFVFNYWYSLVNNNKRGFLFLLIYYKWYLKVYVIYVDFANFLEFRKIISINQKLNKWLTESNFKTTKIVNKNIKKICTLVNKSNERNLKNISVFWVIIKAKVKKH